MQEMDRRRVAIAFGMLEDTDSDVLAARIDAERERCAEMTATGGWRDAEVPAGFATANGAERGEPPVLPRYLPCVPGEGAPGHQVRHD
jgi:hypothetical protein